MSNEILQEIRSVRSDLERMETRLNARTDTVLGEVMEVKAMLAERRPAVQATADAFTALKSQVEDIYVRLNALEATA